MANHIKCFFLAPTKFESQYLRRYAGTFGDCSPNDYHNASVFIGQTLRDPDGVIGDDHPHDDPLWPKTCDCGYQFKDEDNWQLFRRDLYRRDDTGEIMTLHGAPVGAMWYADWYPFKGQDGHSLVVKTPGGEWCIDNRASNCSKPDDDTHRCWVRHGSPPNITVDKNGDSCAAGAGSIAQKDYHGFLRNGYLEQC